MMEDAVPHSTGLGRVRVSGYLHPDYAAALAEFGIPRELPGSKGWLLERQIPDSSFRDAMGCYPLFACADWSQLQGDLESLDRSPLVSVALVTDPFGEYDVNYLEQCFVDRVVPFKQHFVVDLSRPTESFVHSHHRRNARKALQNLQIEECTNPLNFLEEWNNLYKGLTARHSIRGLAAFSKESFAKQLSVSGVVAFRALYNCSTVGMLLWYVQGQVAYYHLGAYSARGYDLRASFALFSRAIEYFATQGLRWLNLGGAAGAGEGQSSGLGRFKEGWSTGVRTAYFCARIIDHEKYQELVKKKFAETSKYFPAYRQGEFT